MALPALPLQSLYQLFPGSEVFMSLNTKIILFLSSLVIFIASCAKVEYTNPLDPKSENYVGPDSSADDDGDGIANYFDEHSDYFKKDKDNPVIELLGKNPDTLRFKLSERAKFDEKKEQLKKDFKCYDPSDKTVDNSDVVVEDNVPFVAGNNYDIKYSVSDTSGNFTRVIRNIVVIILPEDDTTPPTISRNSSLVSQDNTVEVTLGDKIFDFINYVNIYDDDNSVFKIGENVTLEGDDKLNLNKVGKYPVKYTAKDKSGNKSSITIYFDVIDDGGNHSDAQIFIQYDGKDIPDGHVFEYTLPDVSFDLKLLTCKAYEIINNEPVDLPTELDCDFVNNKAGQYHATFSVIGRDDVDPKSVFIIIYESGTTICDTAITLELKGESTIEVKIGEEFKDPGFTATMSKPKEMDVSSKVEVNPTKIDTKKEDVIKISYEIKYCDGNKTISKERTVKIVKSDNEDTTAPEIKLKKSIDTVTVGTKYSEYKSRDTGNTVTDDVDGKISWSKVEIDTSGFKTSEAGRPCSLVYTVKDAAGNKGKAVKKIVVISGSSGGLLNKYGVPSNSPLANMESMTFTTVTVEGSGGPSTSNIQHLKINFKNDQWGDLWEFAIQLKSGNPTHINLIEKGKDNYKFKQSNPEMKLSSTGINGFDAEYYVVYTNKKFVWVEKTGKFAIIWEE